MCVSYTGLCAAAMGRDPVVPIVTEIRVVVSSLGSWHAPFGGVVVVSVGHQTIIDELLFSGTCCIWCLDVLICYAGLSERVFRK